MFACIYVLDFPVEAVVRAEPLLRERAMAILEGKPPLVRVIAVNEKARLCGMEVGMTKLQAAVFAEPKQNSIPVASADPGAKASKETAKAKERHSKIEFSSQRSASKRTSQFAVLRQRSPEQENSTHAALLDVAHSFTPRVEDTASDTLLLDLTGLERLYGAPTKMGHDLASRVSAIGLEANIAVAANPETAMHAAMGFSGTIVIPSGEESRRLGVLPISILLDTFEISPGRRTGNERERGRLREQMLDILERWGVRDFHTLALLPAHGLAARLGEAGTRLQLLACGAGRRTLALCEPLSHFEEVLELESAVETIESLSFLLNRLLEQLCARLEARALAVQELRLRLHLERRVADEETTTTAELHNVAPPSHSVGEPNILERVLRLPVAMRNSKVFLKLLQLELAAHPPGAPVTKVWIRAEPAPPRTAQRGLFLPVTPEAEKLEITMARIKGIVGERRAGIARLLNSHRNSFCLERFSSTQEERKPAASPTMLEGEGYPSLALRIFRPAVPLWVQLKEERPATLSTVASPARRGELQGKVLWSAGPWRSSGDWWTENIKDEMPGEQTGPWNREEWDVAVSNGNPEGTALYRIYRDLASGDWFADASYD
jgi:protein ImuB